MNQEEKLKVFGDISASITTLGEAARQIRILWEMNYLRFPPNDTERLDELLDEIKSKVRDISEVNDLFKGLNKKPNEL